VTRKKHYDWFRMNSADADAPAKITPLGGAALGAIVGGGRLKDVKNAEV
jgi:hypothetical protein